AALGLRHDLRGDDDDVAVPGPVSLVETGQQVGEELAEVVARPDLGQAVGGPDAESFHGSILVQRRVDLVTRAHRTSRGSTSRPKASIHARWLRPTLCR